MKNKIFKLILLLALALILTLSFVSCGSGEKIADDDSGSWEGIVWEYKKDGQTLTLSGTGAMKNAESADSVGWAAIRTSVKTVTVSDTISSIGDYAFYGMTALESVKLSSNTQSIGNYAFSFCSSLTSVSIPEGVTSIGVSAFEGCRALKSVKLPTTVTSMGERTFAFCRTLETVIIPSAPETGIGSWCFKECEKLTTLATLPEMTFADDALEDAAISADKIKKIQTLNSTVINVFYEDADGNTIKDPRAPESKSLGDSYSVVAAAIEGYTVYGNESYTGTVLGEEELNFTFTYKKNEEIVTEKPDETAPNTNEGDKNEGANLGTVIALCIFGVVIVGVCIAAFLLIRSDKKQNKNSTTVRKNSTDRKKK